MPTKYIFVTWGDETRCFNWETGLQVPCGGEQGAQILDCVRPESKKIEVTDDDVVVTTVVLVPK